MMNRWMNRMVQLCCLLLLLPSAIVCADEMTVTPEDARNSDLTVSLMLETENAIYWGDRAEKLLFYLDEETMTWYPVCSKLDCLHQVEQTVMEAKSDCDAFLDCSWVSTLGYWKGRIYYVSQNLMTNVTSIQSMAEDGTDHRLERELEEEIVTAPAYHFYFHRGKAYAVTNFYEEQPGKLYSYHLEDLSEPPLVVEFDSDIITHFGDELSYTRSDPETERFDLYHSDLDGEQKEEALSGLHWSWGIYEGEDAVYQLLGDTGLVRIPYDTKEQTVIWNEMDQYDCGCFNMLSDGQYLYLQGQESEGTQGSADEFLILDMQGAVLEELTVPNMQQVRNDDMEQLQSGELTEAEKQSLQRRLTYSGISSYVGATKDYIFLTDSYVPNWYLERSEIGSGECELKPIKISQ